MPTTIDWPLALLLNAPVLLVLAFLLARRTRANNWQFSLRGILMLMRLAAIVLSAVAWSVVN